MANKVFTESVVTLNATQADATMQALEARADSLRSKMLDATKVGDVKGAEKAKRDLDNIQKAMAGVRKETKNYADILNNLNGSSLSDLNKLYSKLNGQIKHLVPGTDAFIKKSKELDKVKSRIGEVHAMTKRTQSTFGGFFKKIGWSAIIAGAIAGFKKFAEDFVNATQVIGDKWNLFTSGMKQSYGTFLADLADGKGWKEMIENMRESYRVGRQVQMMLDELFEMQNSLTLQESEYNIEIEKNKQLMRDQTLSDEERLAAAEKAVTLEKELAQIRKDIATQEHEAATLALADRTKLSEEDLDFFIRQYNQNKDVVAQAQQLNTLEKAYQDANQGMLKMAGEVTPTMIKSQQEAIDKAQKAYMDYLNSFDDTDAIKRMAKLARQYDLGNDELVQNYVDSRAKMNNADAEFYKSTTRIVTTASGLRKQLADEHAKESEDAYKAEMAAVNAKFKEYEVMAKASYAQGEISEQEYQTRVNTIKENALKERMQVAEKYRKDTTDYLSQLYDLNIKEKERIEKIWSDLDKATEEGIGEFIEAELEEIDSMMNELDEEMSRTIDEELKHFEELQNYAIEVKAALDPIKAIKDQRDAEIEALKEAHEKHLISEKEFQEARKKVVANANAEIADHYAQQGEAYFSAAANMVGAFQEAAASSLEAQKQKELTAAGDNAEKRAEIEQKYEEKQLAMKKKFATVDMTIGIAKALADGALAVVKGFAELGPIGGGIFAGIIAATTAAQVATIIAQRNAIMNTSVGSTGGAGASAVGERTVAGFSEGGFTSKAASDNTAVGVVHANEWVAPAAMVRANPITFASLEEIRTKGKAHGFKEGGFSSSKSSQAPADAGIVDAINRLLAAIPFPCYVVTSDLNAAIEMENRMKSKTGKK